MIKIHYQIKRIAKFTTNYKFTAALNEEFLSDAKILSVAKLSGHYNAFLSQDLESLSEDYLRAKLLVVIKLKLKSKNV